MWQAARTHVQGSPLHPVPHASAYGAYTAHGVIELMTAVAADPELSNKCQQRTCATALRDWCACPVHWLRESACLRNGGVDT